MPRPCCQADEPLPADLAALEEPERFLITAYRRWIAGLSGSRPAQWSLVWNDFAARLGAAEGRQGLAALTSLVLALQRHARRRIACAPPCCGQVCADEICLASFVAACQQGRWRRARAAAEWLVHAEGIGPMLQAGDRLARAMGARSLTLVLRGGDRPHLPAIRLAYTAPPRSRGGSTASPVIRSESG